MTCDFLSFTQMCITWETKPRTQKFKTDVLPPLYHSLTETPCATASIVYIRSNKDDKVANTL